MVIYSGKEFNKLNDSSNYYKILNNDLKTKEGVQLSIGLNCCCKEKEEKKKTLGVNFLSSPLVFMEGEYVLDFLGHHDTLEDPTVFSVTIPDDATVFVEDEDFVEKDRDYYPVKYITDKLIINYRLTDGDFLYLFKSEGWIYIYHKKQEDAICRFLVRSGFYDTLYYVKSGEALSSDIKKRPIIYNWNVSVSQEAARKGNLQLLEEICCTYVHTTDPKKKSTSCPIDLYALEVFRRECRRSGSGFERVEEGEELIKKLVERHKRLHL